MYTHISALHVLSSALSTRSCALWHLFKHTHCQEDKLCTSLVHSIVNIHMYFPWVQTPSFHFHMSKEASRQSTNTTATTCTFSCFFCLFVFFLSSTMPPLAEDTPFLFFHPAGQGWGGQKDENVSCPALPAKKHAKTGLVSSEETVTKLPTFPYSLALFHCVLSRHLIGL